MSHCAPHQGVSRLPKAKCGSCHTSTLLTDQNLHNICSPQAGPGRGDVAPEDIGGLPSELRDTFVDDPTILQAMLSTLDPAVQQPTELTNAALE